MIYKFKFTLLAGISLLTGCAITPQSVEVDDSIPKSYITASSIDTAEQDPGQWWLGFDDETLAELVSAAQSDNLGIRESLARLSATYELTRAARSDLLPTFDGFVDSRIGSLLSSGMDVNLTGSAGAGFTFNPDINGQLDARLEAAEEDYIAAEFGVANLRRLIAESVALQYVELRRTGARLALLQSTLDLQQRTLEIVEARYAAGLSPKLDVDRTRADLSRTRAQQSIILSNRSQAEYSLAVLTGQLPGSVDLGTSETDEIPVFSSGPQIVLPANLIRRRPDIQAAEANLRAAVTRIGVEQADLLPSLRLPGQLSAGFGDVSGTADEISLSLSALVDIPILDYGRRQAEVDAQRARAEAAAFAYRANILTALREVESALVEIEAIKISLNEQLESVRSSEAAYEQLDALYREGLASFIDVLDAQRTLISSRESILATEANLASAIISLYAALDAGCADVSMEGCESIRGVPATDTPT